MTGLDPTPQTKREIFEIMQNELNELNDTDQRGEFEHEIYTLVMTCKEMWEIHRKLGETDELTEEMFRLNASEKSEDKEKTNQQFTKLYSNAAEMAGYAIRMMAMVRKGIISSEILSKIDSCVGDQVNG